MKRYIDLHNEDWSERTYSQMQLARLESCMEDIMPCIPGAGVIHTLAIDELLKLIENGWVDVPQAPSDHLIRRSAMDAVLCTLADDLDCLSPMEHMLTERMLINEGYAYLESVEEIEASFTLRMRLWCDVGVKDGMLCVRLDDTLLEKLPDLLMRPEHLGVRSRIFIFDGMVHALLYMSGFLDMTTPIQHFIGEVLLREQSHETLRLARNYLEASFDCCQMTGCTLLLHGALSAPETLVGTLAAYGVSKENTITAEQLTGAMNELLPEEAASEAKLRLCLSDVLRPEYEADEAAADLRLLAKQGAPIEALKEIMTQMIYVLPTEHMQAALFEMYSQTPRWTSPQVVDTAVQGKQGMWRLH